MLIRRCFHNCAIVKSRIIKKVVCAVSGGVDSTVAALILKRKGYEVLGVFMKNWDLLDENGVCADFQDREDAKKVCQQLDIPFREVNFVKEYWNEVFSDFLEDYKNGLTPNPDIMCNKRIKFHAFVQHAISQFGADAIATGHYVRSTFGEDLEHYNPEIGAHLLRGVDHKKDQSFFLSQISQQALQHFIFPLGNLTKQQVKEIAISANFEKVAKKKESMGICFIGKRKFQEFIEDYIEPKPGKFINIDDGQIVGTHKGIHYWTLGQRCPIPEHNLAFFIARKDLKTHDIYVAPGTNHPSLYNETLTTNQPHWIHSCPEELNDDHVFHCGFQFQHTDPVIDCQIHLLENNYLHVKLSSPLRAITPGQFAAFFRGDECLGSARILEIGTSLDSHYHQNHLAQHDEIDYDVQKPSTSSAL